MSDLPKLTPLQLAYAMARISGKNQKESFIEARPRNRLSPTALSVEAHKLEHHPKVRAHIEAAISEQRKEKLLTRDTKRQILGEIAQDKKAPKNTRIMAVKVDNDMTGDTKIRFEGEVTLGIVFERMKGVTDLPSAQEVLQLKDVTPMPGLAPVERMQTAMERAQ